MNFLKYLCHKLYAFYNIYLRTKFSLCTDIGFIIYKLYYLKITVYDWKSRICKYGDEIKLTNLVCIYTELFGIMQHWKTNIALLLVSFPWSFGKF